MKKNNTLQIAFLVVGTLTALEFIFVQGLFTWLMAVGATIIVGSVNIIMSIRNKQWFEVWTFALLIVALCMGYFEMI